MLMLNVHKRKQIKSVSSVQKRRLNDLNVFSFAMSDISHTNKCNAENMDSVSTYL